MNCEEAFRKLYGYLNDDTNALVDEEVKRNLKIARQCCDICQFNGQIKKAMQTAVLARKPSRSLKAKILNSIQAQ